MTFVESILRAMSLMPSAIHASTFPPVPGDSLHLLSLLCLILTFSADRQNYNWESCPRYRGSCSVSFADSLAQWVMCSLSAQRTATGSSTRPATPEAIMWYVVLSQLEQEDTHAPHSHYSGNTTSTLPVNSRDLHLGPLGLLCPSI